MARILGASSDANLWSPTVRVLMPKSDGMKRATPALTAASMTSGCSAVACRDSSDTTASCPRRASTRAGLDARSMRRTATDAGNWAVDSGRLMAVTWKAEARSALDDCRANVSRGLGSRIY